MISKVRIWLENQRVRKGWGTNDPITVMSAVIFFIDFQKKVYKEFVIIPPNGVMMTVRLRVRDREHAQELVDEMNLVINFYQANEPVDVIVNPVDWDHRQRKGTTYYLESIKRSDDASK